MLEAPLAEYDLIYRSGEQPAWCGDGAENGTAEVEEMNRFVVVGDVESCRVIAQSTQRAVATAISRPQPLVDRRTHVYLDAIKTGDD